MQFCLEERADFVERKPGVMLVEKSCRCTQFGGGIGTMRKQNAVLYVAAFGDDDEQDAVLGQPDEFDLADARRFPTRRDDHPGKPGQVRKQVGSRVHQALWLVGLELPFKFLYPYAFHRQHRKQGVDEKTVSPRRGYSACRGMRAGDIAHFFQVAHDVAHRGGRQFKAG